MDDYRFYASLLYPDSSIPPSLSSIAHVLRGFDGKPRWYGDEIWSKVGGYTHPGAGARLLQYGLIPLMTLMMAIGMGWLPDKSVNPTLIYDNYLQDGAV